MEEKLYFEGIEIGTHIDQFLAVLKEKGYVQDLAISDLNLGIECLSGYYTDYRDVCDIIIQADDKGMVYKVTITGKELYTDDAVLRDFDFFKAKAEEYNLEQVCEADDSFSFDDLAPISDFTKNKFVYYSCEQKNQEIFVTIGTGKNNSLNVSMVLSNQIHILNKNNISNIDRLDVKKLYTQEIIRNRRRAVRSNIHDNYKFELFLASIAGCAGGFIMALFGMILSSDSSSFLLIFLISSIGFTLVCFLALIAKDHGYDVFPDDSKSYRDSSSRAPSMRVRKYKPTNWKTKNRDKLFY